MSRLEAAEQAAADRTATPEPKITRERIELFLHEARQFNDDYLVRFAPDELVALCTLALQAEAMQPRPIKDSPVKTHCLVREGKNDLWHIARYDPDKGNWYESKTGYLLLRSERLKEFIPLSSLPEPRR